MAITSLITVLAIAQNASAPAQLNWDNYDQVKQYVSLKQRDLQFQEIHWHPKLIDGVIQAQKQDKPLVLWLYFGDPRGNC